MILLVLALLAALAGAIAPNAAHDGRHDFDFEIGTWRMPPSARIHVVRKLWDGATIAQLVVPQPVRYVRGSLLSIYRPATRQWSIYWADARDGTLSSPLVGCFRNGTGTFVAHDMVAGRPALIRLVYSNISQRSFQTEQSESFDGGRTWVRAKTQDYERTSPR